MASTRAIPASGAWIEGRDAVGERKFVDLPGPHVLEQGGQLPVVRVAYETHGTLNAARDNAILVEHALTGDSHVAGLTVVGHRSEGWWDDLVGPGRALDTDRYFIVSANVLGGCQGTTGPSSLASDGKPWGSRFPAITVRDQVDVEVALADALGISSWASVVGGSMGGMRVLEWASSHPDRVSSIVVLASSSYATAAQIATQTLQIEAIRNDPKYRGGDYYSAPDGDGPNVGLGVARKVAFLTYRSEPELDERFGRDSQPGTDQFAVQSYFAYQADKLALRFDANTYIVLNEAMNRWNLGGSADRSVNVAALEKIDVPAVVAGVDSDELYPLRLQRELADALPNVIGGLRVITSKYGHDGFLLETEQVAACIRDALASR